jgi:hypothetical protein
MANIFTCGNGNKIIAPVDRTDAGTNLRNWHKMDEAGLNIADYGLGGNTMTAENGSGIGYQHTGFGGIPCIRTTEGASIRSNIGTSGSLTNFSIGQLIRHEGFIGAAGAAGGYVTLLYGRAWYCLLMLWAADQFPTGDVRIGLLFSSTYLVGSTDCIKKDTDQHLMLTHDYSQVSNTNRIKIYIDGELVDGIDTFPLTIPNGLTPSLFGGANTTYTSQAEQAHGEIWDKVLVPADFVEAKATGGRRNAIGNGIGRGIGRGLR